VLFFFLFVFVLYLQTATAATRLFAGRVGWVRGDVLDTSNAKTGTGQSTESGLSTWTRGLGTSTTSSTKLDVQSSDSTLLALLSNVLGGKHSSIWGRLITISLDLHTSGNTGDSFLSGQISNML
jgi:hypothetical protein